MAVFKVLILLSQIDNNTYDLILQNDLNTKGFTQWFNFKVQNKRNKFVAKFNIVNLVLILTCSIKQNRCIIWEWSQ